MTSAFARRMACASSCSLARASMVRSSTAERERNSRSSFSSRSANSWMTTLSRSSKASTPVTPNRLFTIASYFDEEFIQLFNDADRSIHAGEEFLHIILLKLLAFGVAPVRLGFRPAKRKLLAD